MSNINMIKYLANFFNVPTNHLVKGMENDTVSQQINLNVNKNIINLFVIECNINRVSRKCIT